MIRNTLESLREPCGRVVAVASRYWLIAESAVLRGLRRLAALILRALEATAPVVERGLIAATPSVVAADRVIEGKLFKLWSWLQPWLEKAWRLIAPVRAWLLKGCSWLLNLRIQCGDMNPRETAVFEEHLNPAEVAGLIRTRSRVDVGMWWRKGRVWVSMQPGELVLLAQGKSVWMERITNDALRESRYNHVTGEVALAPKEDLPLKTLRVKPLEGIEILKSIGTKETQHA